MENSQGVSKKRWISALRSGEFKRATGTLEKTSPKGRVIGHCCLGVACVIQGVPQEAYQGDGSISRKMAKIARFPIPDVINSDITQLKDRDGQSAVDILIDMNDKKGGSFIKIANWIEKNL